MERDQLIPRPILCSVLLNSGGLPRPECSSSSDAVSFKGGHGFEFSVFCLFAFLTEGTCWHKP